MKIPSAALFMLLLVLLLIGEAFPCGWVLLNPPLKRDGFVDPELAARIPLSMWTQEQAFDSASECESERSRQWKEVLARINQADMDEKEKSELRVNFLVRTTTQRCVPFDAISDKHPFRGR